MRGLLGRTNVIVTSDHGFTTNVGGVSVSEALVDAGLKQSPGSLDVVIAGGAVHVREGGPARVDSIVRVLQRSEWVGAVFTRGDAGSDLGSVDGTIAFSAVGWDHARSADVLVSAGWSDGENQFGYRGEVFVGGTAGHGSASPWDIRAAFVADGPSIKNFQASPIPSGNIDIMPTVMELLGQPVPSDMDGRVLAEILEGGPFPGEIEFTPEIIETGADLGDVRYDLIAYRTRVGSTVYFDGFDVTRSAR